MEYHKKLLTFGYLTFVKLTKKLDNEYKYTRGIGKQQLLSFLLASFCLRLE
jgi:hypothetical protein